MSDTYIPSKSAIDQFCEAMVKKGITPPEMIEADGKIHRFSSNGKSDDDAGWYVFSDSNIATGAFGDFRTGQVVKAWVADIGRVLSSVEKSDFRQKQDELRAQREADIAQRRAAAKTKAATILRVSSPAYDGHPYLIRKKVEAYGLRQWNNLIVIPMIDESTEVQSLQLISSDGDKKFLSGGKMQGCYFPIGSLKNAYTVLIAEGYATAATLHEATGIPVIVAFNAGNLLGVSKSIRAQYPAMSIILCADDDIKTKGNPGLTKATEAADAVNGKRIIPDFGDDRPDGTTDFNDMAAHLGIEAVTGLFISRSLNLGYRIPVTLKPRLANPSLSRPSL